MSDDGYVRDDDSSVRELVLGALAGGGPAWAVARPDFRGGVRYRMRRRSARTPLGSTVRTTMKTAITETAAPTETVSTFQNHSTKPHSAIMMNPQGRLRTANLASPRPVDRRDPDADARPTQGQEERS